MKSGTASKRRKRETKWPDRYQPVGPFSCGKQIDASARPGPRDQTAIGAVSGSWWR